MAGNSFGKMFRITTWGESHGVGVGCVVDGVPSNMLLDENRIASDMMRRSPGQSSLTTSRKEVDQVKILSGVFEGVTTGTPISLMIENSNVRSNDYSNIKDLFRPGHADYNYHQKYDTRDYRGGGRSSARTTAAIVAAGSIAKQLLESLMDNFEILTYTSSVHNIKANIDHDSITFEAIEANPIRCPDNSTADKMIQLIKKVKAEGDSVGGVIECYIKGVPVGIGEPVFDKLDSLLAQAMMSINASKGFEMGDGFESTTLFGSQNNDCYNPDGTTTTNHAGGVIGGISTGMPIKFRVAFKPTPSITKVQSTINQAREQVEVITTGRHDPCVLPRAVPVVEAMACIVLCDLFLQSKKDHIIERAL